MKLRKIRLIRVICVQKEFYYFHELFSLCPSASPACPVAPADGTGVAPADGTVVPNLLILILMPNAT